MKWTKEQWVMSILSDVQSHLEMGFDSQSTIGLINQAKRVLNGNFKESEDGLTIEVETVKQQLHSRTFIMTPVEVKK